MNLEQALEENRRLREVLEEVKIRLKQEHGPRDHEPECYLCGLWPIVIAGLTHAVSGEPDGYDWAAHYKTQADALEAQLASATTSAVQQRDEIARLREANTRMRKAISTAWTAHTIKEVMEALGTVIRDANCDRAALTPTYGEAEGSDEQESFERWAKSRNYEMAQHPLHYLFLDEKTYHARQGWKAAMHWQPLPSPPSAGATPESGEPHPAYDYAARLLRSLAPQCEPLPDMLGVLTQIDNYITGLPRYQGPGDEYEVPAVSVQASEPHPDTVLLDFLERWLQDNLYHFDLAIQSDEEDGIWFTQIWRYESGVLHGVALDTDATPKTTIRAAIAAMKSAESTKEGV
jgi:hypothetical protein